MIEVSTQVEIVDMVQISPNIRQLKEIIVKYLDNLR